MITLTMRTDKPEAEIGIYDNQKQLAYETWQAHRELAETIHKRLQKILNMLSISLEDVEGIICFKGPGSFYRFKNWPDGRQRPSLCAKSSNCCNRRFGMEREWDQGFTEWKKPKNSPTRIRRRTKHHQTA